MSLKCGRGRVPRKPMFIDEVKVVVSPTGMDEVRVAGVLDLVGFDMLISSSRIEPDSS